jgi:hypothetical protein
MDADINICLPECKHACVCSGCFAEISETDRKQEEDLTVMEEAKRKIGDRDNVYVVIAVGQGCLWYVKRVEREYSSFFLHGDNHGQYGEDTNHIPQLNAFLGECRQIESRRTSALE